MILFVLFGAFLLLLVSPSLSLNAVSLLRGKQQPLEASVDTIEQGERRSLKMKLKKEMNEKNEKKKHQYG